MVLPLALLEPQPSARDWTWFGVLLAAAILQAELSAQVERMRRFFSSGPHINVSSVWLFAATLTISPAPTCLLVVLIYAHLWLRVWRTVPGALLYRVTCSAATAVLSVLAAWAVPEFLGLHREPLGPATIIVTGVSFIVVNTILVMIGFKLHNPRRGLLSFVGSWADNALEIVTLCLGATTAVALAANPGLVAFMVLPVVLLPRGELGRRLEMATGYDHKTGLLTMSEWRKRAETEVGSGNRGNDQCGILMIDIDHFKRINDTYGHLTGDVVLRAVADAVRREVRVYDSVGRFGGEEFVVLLPGIDHDHAVTVAERIRYAVTELAVADGETTIEDLSVSVGVALHPDAGGAVDEVLGAADRAVYLAKRSGRNRVCGPVSF